MLGLDLSADCQSQYLETLVAKAQAIRVTVVVEETHGGKNGSPDRNDVKLGNVVVLEQTFRHFQSVGGGNLKVPEE